MKRSEDGEPTSASGDAWAGLDATAQAELVRSGQASPVELVQAACERIERLDGALAAVPIRLCDEALDRVRKRAPRGPFAGVPFLMKDVGARQEGQPYYAGNRALRDADHRAAADTPLGTRFRELGLVTIGKSSTPEFGLQSNTWPLAGGPTRNPWAPAHAAGGSSGGACAAVAAGLVPVAHASDGAGSIRIPAAWCGLIGLKPSRDRIVWRHAGKQRSDVEFVVARSLRDTAAFLDALLAAPRAPGDAQGFAQQLTARAAGSTSAGLRVGLLLHSPAGTPVHAACLAGTEGLGKHLAELGHHVEESAPASLDDYEARALHGSLLGPAEYRECLEELEERLGRTVGPGDVEPFLWELSRHGIEDATAEQFAEAAAWNADWMARTSGWFDTHDLLLTPTVCEPAPPLSALDPHVLAPLDLLERMVPHMAFTEAWNATGLPALTVPAGFTDEGLPVGVQLVAGPDREALLLGVAAALEEAGALHTGARPPMHA